MIRANLIPAARRRAAEARRRLRAWMVLGSAYGVGLAVVAVAVAGSSTGGGQTEQRLRSTISQAHQAGEDIERLSGQIHRARFSVNASRTVGKRPDWSLLLALVSEDLSEDLALQSFRLEPMGDGVKTTGHSDRYALHLAGVGASQSAVSQFVLRLEGGGLFESVTLNGTRTGKFQGRDVTTFSVTCLLAEREGTS